MQTSLVVRQGRVDETPACNVQVEFRLSQSKWLQVKAGENPVRGVRAGVHNWLVESNCCSENRVTDRRPAGCAGSFNAAGVGSCSLVTKNTGRDLSGDREQIS